MTFTDDDLKRLKEDVASDDINKKYTSIEKMKALLSRLEAAEYCVNKLADLNGFLDKPIYDGEGHVVSISNLINNWRKAAGK